MRVIGEEAAIFRKQSASASLHGPTLDEWVAQEDLRIARHLALAATLFARRRR